MTLAKLQQSSEQQTSSVLARATRPDYVSTFIKEEMMKNTLEFGKFSGEEKRM
jgi:hypothetical protein